MSSWSHFPTPVILAVVVERYRVKVVVRVLNMIDDAQHDGTQVDVLLVANGFECVAGPSVARAGDRAGVCSTTYDIGPGPSGTVRLDAPSKTVSPSAMVWNCLEAIDRPSTTSSCPNSGRCSRWAITRRVSGFNQWSLDHLAVLIRLFRFDQWCI